ncbi:MAG: M14 family zinc carboxypeptidase [Bacteroidia bacterium]
MKKLTYILTILFSISLCITTLKAQTSSYKKIKVYGNQEQMNELLKKGVCMDHGDRKAGYWFASYFNSNEYAIIQQSGLKYEILIDDATAFDQNQNKTVSKLQSIVNCNNNNAPVYPVPTHFKYGSMGGFYTYAEMLSDLDSMALLYPNLITVKQPIDTGLTWDGNMLYYIKVSDNPNVSEPEPQVYYSALHHAREPLSMQQLMYYLWYLLENYGTDPLVQEIVNNRELYFIPCINPDGYLYNESTNPGGGGYWRKNRRDNSDGTYGVDLNRNYDEAWGYDDLGSSPATSSDVYRGPSPASEPEIQMVKNFINAHQFVTGMDFHTYGNHILYPWSYIPDFYTPDSAAYVQLAENYTAFNHYDFGTCNQTLNYIANGGSIDWLYGEQTTKPKIYDFTPECGYSFWPAQVDIIPIIQDAIHMDFTAALAAGKYAKLYDKTLHLVSSLNSYIQFDLQQLGLDTAATYTVSVTPLSPVISSVGGSKTFSNLNYMQVVSDSISFALTGLQVNGTELKFLVTLDNGSYQVHDTITKLFGLPVILVADNGSNMNNWDAGTQWGTTTSTFYSPPSSITDSPFGDYQPFDYNPLLSATTIDLTSVVKAGLSFYAKWAIEPNYDYVELAASDDGGSTWTPLCGKYTHPGTAAQDPGMPLYDGHRTNWVMEEVSLDDYIGSTILLQFVLVSDGGSELDGFYFDDLTVWALNNNVGINENQSPVFMSSVYPNPANTTASISYSIPATGKYQLSISNALGQQVYSQTLENAKTNCTINLKNFTPGVYYCKISNDSGNSAVKQLVVIKF